MIDPLDPQVAITSGELSHGRFWVHSLPASSRIFDKVPVNTAYENINLPTKHKIKGFRYNDTSTAN